MKTQYINTFQREAMGYDRQPMTHTDKQPQTEDRIIPVIEEKWDEFSTYIDDDISSLSMVAGSSVINKSDFTKAVLSVIKETHLLLTPEELEALLQKERREAAEKAFQAGEKHGSDCAYNSIGNSSIDHPPAFIWLEENYPLPQPPKQ